MLPPTNFTDVSRVRARARQVVYGLLVSNCAACVDVLGLRDVQPSESTQEEIKKITEILPNRVYLTGSYCAADWDQLDVRGITHIICLTMDSYETKEEAQVTHHMHACLHH